MGHPQANLSTLCCKTLGDVLTQTLTDIGMFEQTADPGLSLQLLVI